MVIITGLGRCGTSFLTKFIQQCGIPIGRNVHWHPEAKAGLELSTFYTLVDDLYQTFCKKGLPINLDTECLGDYWKPNTYRQAFNKVDNDDRQGKVLVVKDPRLTWSPNLIDAIYEARLGDIKVILCHREIKDIMKSRESLSKRYGDPKPRKILSDYQIDFAEFYTRLLKLQIKHRVLFYPDFANNLSLTYSVLLEMGIEIEKKKAIEVWNKVAWEKVMK